MTRDAPADVGCMPAPGLWGEADMKVVPAGVCADEAAGIGAGMAVPSSALTPMLVGGGLDAYGELYVGACGTEGDGP